MESLQRRPFNTFFTESYQKKYVAQRLELQEEVRQQYGKVLPVLHSRVDSLWRFCSRVVRPTLVWFYTTQADYFHYHYRMADKQTKLKAHELWVKAELRLAVANGLKYVSYTYATPGYRYRSDEHAFTARVLYLRRWNLLNSKPLSFD